MIQCLVEVSSQQTGILGLVELAGANDGSRDGMGSDEVANRCPDEPVVGGDRAVTAIQKEEECLPGVVDAAGEVRRCHAGAGQVVLQLEAYFVGVWQAGLQQLPAFRVRESHAYSPSVNSRTISSMKPGRAAVARSCGRSRVGEGGGEGGEYFSLGISARSCRWAISLRSPARARMRDRPVT